MKVNSVGTNLNIYSHNIHFGSENIVLGQTQGHDEFLCAQKDNNKKKNPILHIIGGAALIGIGGFLLFKSAKTPKTVNNIPEFKNIKQVQEFFEKIGIETDLRGATNEHLPLLNRITGNLKQLKDMGVKVNKPDSITISDWKNKAQLEELHKQKGVSSDEYRPDYFAQTLTSKDNKNHIFINSNNPEFDMFRHEMGHVNDFAHDGYWHFKGVSGYDYIDKQLEILGQNEKVTRSAGNFNNIFFFNTTKTNTKFAFPNKDMEKRFVYAQNMISKMQEETQCYAPQLLHEQKAYIFEELLKGKNFSDEVMLYYDFAGGARIPNLTIKGKKYDEYIESLYNNPELIQKLRENIKISKI